MAMAHVGDPRLEGLEGVYNPKKTTHVQIEVVDPPLGGTTSFSSRETGRMRDLPGLLVVVRAFLNPALPHPLGRIDPLGDLSHLVQEAAFQDLAQVEGALERIQGELAKGLKDRLPVAHALERLHPTLSEGCFPSLSEEDEVLLASFGLLTLKPWLVIFNLDEGDLGAGEAFLSEVQAEWPGITSCAGSIAVEGEIQELDAEDRRAFLEDLGLAEPLRDRLLREVIHSLGKQVFYTGGPTEVRAWLVPQGATAQEAAGAIHADLARTFVRAERFPVDDLIRLGSEKAVKDAGSWSLLGREAVIGSRDCLLIRHTG